MEELLRPAPVATPETQPFWEAAREERLLIQWCTACGAGVFYPRIACPTCAGSLEWRESTGRGTVYSFTVTRRAAHPALKEKVPYVVAIVELKEGVRLLANLVDCTPESVQIGAQVQVCFEHMEGVVLPQFRML